MCVCVFLSSCLHFVSAPIFNYSVQLECLFWRCRFANRCSSAPHQAANQIVERERKKRKREKNTYFLQFNLCTREFYEELLCLIIHSLLMIIKGTRAWVRSANSGNEYAHCIKTERQRFRTLSFSFAFNIKLTKRKKNPTEKIMWEIPFLHLVAS